MYLLVHTTRLSPSQEEPMPFAPFHELCLDVAQRETRTITVLPAAKLGMPLGDYQFIEMYCNERGCDCRMASFSAPSAVVSPHWRW